MDWLEEDGRFDMGRIYATGQSAGGSATFGYAKDYTDKLAAVYWSNSPGSVSTAEGTNPIPAGMFIGDGNYSNRGIPMFNNKEEADAAGAVIYWDDIGTDASPAGIEKWKRYFYSANGIGQENISDTIIYRGGNAMNRGLDNPNGTIAEWQTNNARYRTFTWTKDFGPGVEDIPVLSYTLSLYQAHNNLPGYNAIMWDFMKHYSVEVDDNNNVQRYYSESGFVEDDKIKIFEEPSTKELVKIVEISTPIADGTGSITNIGKYEIIGPTNIDSGFAVTVSGTAVLASFESANEGQGEGQWVGLLITTDRDIVDLSVKTPIMSEFVNLGEADIEEAVAAGAIGRKTFVWWLKAEELTVSKDIWVKVASEEDNTAIKISVSYEAYMND
jgi:hypothetical protein